MNCPCIDCLCSCICKWKKHIPQVRKECSLVDLYIFLSNDGNEHISRIVITTEILNGSWKDNLIQKYEECKIDYQKYLKL